MAGTLAAWQPSHKHFSYLNIDVRVWVGYKGYNLRSMDQEAEEFNITKSYCLIIKNYVSIYLFV